MKISQTVTQTEISARNIMCPVVELENVVHLLPQYTGLMYV